MRIAILLSMQYQLMACSLSFRRPILNNDTKLGDPYCIWYVWGTASRHSYHVPRPNLELPATSNKLRWSKLAASQRYRHTLKSQSRSLCQSQRQSGVFLSAVHIIINPKTTNNATLTSTTPTASNGINKSARPGGVRACPASYAVSKNERSGILGSENTRHEMLVLFFETHSATQKPSPALD